MRAVFRNGPFLRLWLAQAVSQTANNMVNFALLLRVREIIEIHDLRHPNTAISLVILAFSLPSVLFGPIAGVVADRMNRRTVMAGTNALRAVAVLCFLVIQPEWPVMTILVAHYVVTFLFGIAGQFFAPAQGATIPQLVPREQLIHANALFNLTFTGAQLLGFATLGPVLIKVIGVDRLFAVTVAAFIVSTVLVITLPRSLRLAAAATAPPAHPVRRLINDVREGVVFILADGFLMKAIFYLSLAATTFLMVAALGPDFITSVIGLPKEDIGFIVGPAGLGVFCGVVLVSLVARRFDRATLIDWAMASAGVVLLLLALSKSIVDRLWLWDETPSGLLTGVTAGLAALLGFCNAFILVPAQTMLQERSHEQIRARVYATFFMISNTVSFLPIFFAAALADLFGVVRVLVIVSVLVGAIGLGSVWRRWRLERARWEAPRRRHREGPETLFRDQQ